MLSTGSLARHNLEQIAHEASAGTNAVLSEQFERMTAMVEVMKA